MGSPSFPRRVTILGSTGFIGRKAMKVAEQYADKIRVVSVAAHRSVDRLAGQAQRLGVERVVVGEPSLVDDLRARVPGISVAGGMDAIVELAAAPDVDVVLNAIVGRAGLEASLAAVGSGKTLALANKESLVLAGELIMKTARRTGAVVLPVDSEHSGLFQCLEGRPRDQVERLILTASGGPFRGRPRGELQNVSPREALAHPVWPMGPRITVDSATLLNKGLEVIEAHHLFETPLDSIEVWVHPQSVVHALVELKDGSLLAQLSAPDMTIPVQFALSYPERWNAAAPACSLPDRGSLEFERPDHEAFPALRLAYRAGERGGTAPTVLNAADEVGVEAFLAGRLSFPGIAELLEEVLDSVPTEPADSLDAVVAADARARERARNLLEARAR